MRVLRKSNNDLLRLNLQMILDVFDELLWDYEVHGNRSHDRFRGVQLYYGQKDMERDQIYVVPAEFAHSFPSDRYGFITTAEMDGVSPGISSVNQPQDLIVSVLLKLFQEYYAFEASVNNPCYFISMYEGKEIPVIPKALTRGIPRGTEAKPRLVIYVK